MLAGGPKKTSIVEQSSAVDAGMLLLGSVGVLKLFSEAGMARHSSFKSLILGA